MMRSLLLLLPLLLLPTLAAPLFADGEVEPIIEISRGQIVSLKDHVVPGKVTIFEFYSHFCPSCSFTSPKVEALVTGFPDFVLRKIDINRPGALGNDFGSAVARQYSLTAIPHFKIYDPKGKFRAEGREAYHQVLLWHWLYVEGHIKGVAPAEK